MAIQFVGGNYTSGLGGSGTLVVSLSSLVSGVDTAARAGDFVVALAANSTGTGSATTLGVSGSDGNVYTNLSKLTVAETIDPSACVAYKYLTAADASVTVWGATSTTGGKIGLVSVWRGVNSVTPLIASQSGSASGTNSPLPIFAAVTPTIPGSVVLAVGTGSVSDMIQFTMGANYTRAIGAINSGARSTTSGICGAIGYRLWPGYAAETPPSWTGPTDSNAEGYIANTLVLNPSPNKSVFTTSNT
jgi:hypothetical protein